MPPSKNPPHGRIPSYSRLTRPRPGRRSPNARKAHAAQSTASRQILNVRSAVLMDARTGKILYSQNPDVRIPPASLTKIMSMMVTFDAIRSGKVKLSDQIRVSRHAARQGGSRMGLRAGERVSLNRLLMGMAVSSGNDASMAVAERVGRFGPRLRQDDEQQGPPDRHVLQHVQNAQRPARRRSVHHSQRYGAAWIRVPQEQSLRAPIPPRPRAQAPGGGHNEQKPAARGLPRCRRP